MGVADDNSIVFDVDRVVGEEIRAVDEYGRVRVRLVAWLAEVCIPIKIDVGFGDAVVPSPRL